jgi:hypothetical protein
VRLLEFRSILEKMENAVVVDLELRFWRFAAKSEETQLFDQLHQWRHDTHGPPVAMRPESS